MVLFTKYHEECSRSWIYICSENHFYASSTELSYDVQILFTSVQKGTVADIDEALKVCYVVSTQGDYKFCPGLDEREYYDNYYTVI